MVGMLWAEGCRRRNANKEKEMSVELVDRGSFLHIRFFGTMESKDFREIFQAFEKYEQDTSQVPNRITTFGEIDDFVIQFSGMLPMAQDRSQRLFNPPLKSAVVASRPIEKAAASMVQSMNMNETIQIRVFPSFAEAEAWVRE